MNMYRRFLSAALLMLPLYSWSESSSLSFSPSVTPVISPPELSDMQWRWLGGKREVVMGLYGTVRPPVVSIDPVGRLSGFVPDFVWNAARSLGLSMRVLHFSNAEEAYNALRSGSIDVVFSPAGDSVPVRYGPEDIVELAPALPVVIRRANSQQIASKGKNITTNTSPGSKLAALNQGLLDSVTLPAGEAYYLTERNYVNTLEIDEISAPLLTPYQLVTEKQNPVLGLTLRAAAEHLRKSSAGEILASRWDQNDMVRFVSVPLNLTAAEKTWLSAHAGSGVSVAVSAFNAPFFISGSGGRYAGIGPELLELISLKTGLRFHYTEINDSRDIVSNMRKGEVSMTAPLLWSRDRTRDFLLTTPFLFTPIVMITRSNSNEHDKIMSAALVPGQDSSDWFIKMYPQAKISWQGNASLAIQWVADGKIDATLSTLISARYLVEGLYQDKVMLQQGLSVADAAVVFGVSHSDPELLGILNKTMAQLSPGMVTNILTHWQSTPAARFNTWKIYRTEFYTGAAAALLLILFTSVWAILLRQQVRRTQLAKALLRQEISFRDRLIDGPPRPVYVATPDGVITRSNRAFHRYFDEGMSHYLSLSLFDVRHPLYEVWEACMRNLPAQGLPAEAEFTIRNSADEVRHIRHWITEFEEEEGLAGGYIGGWQDVTEYLNMQAALTDARAEAEQASRTKSRFLATMSHEIRTPLSAIIGLLELQAKEGRTDAELIRMAHESSLSLLALIGDVLDIARIESGKITLAPRWSLLSSIVTPVTQAFSGLARQKRLKLSLSITDADTEVLVDDSRIRQILANLIGNAIKFTPSGQVQVQVKITTESASELLLEVMDTGPGIPEEDQARLFSPFEQAGETSEGGSGLGLAISREIAALMGGTLTLFSQAGKGCIFSLRIPIETRPAAISQHLEKPDLPETQTPLRVLIVDDHPANRLLLSRQLTLLGHAFSEAEDGSAGLTAWRFYKPDVILTDCSMPSMDGPEMTRQIRLEDKDVVIVGITANAQDSEKQRCLDAGMNACLFRPVELNRLADTLKTYTSEVDNLNDISYWLDMNALTAFLPESPDAVSTFIKTVISETQRDLQYAREAIAGCDYDAARRIFHRISGTVRVVGVKQLGEHCELLEELAEMDEEEAVIMQHICCAESMLKTFSTAFYASSLYLP